MKADRLLPGAVAAVILFMFLMLAPAASAGFEMTRHTMDGGGGMSSGAALALHGTIGQPDAGLCQGASLTLRGGFWAFPLPPPQRKGDFEPDGDVDFWDFMVFVDVYDMTDEDPGWNETCIIGDFDDDGDVDFWDFMFFVDVYGT